ncbi:MAG: bifunctional metallophosphatase/5'-nucleotidase [Muribaculaceae bacterium]|nr:bifunctional metallophosphatase/5'-nucleotidase [Muribaculaceae bacterium]
MKHKYLPAVLAIAFAASSLTVDAERIVIIHTNDTHSQIDPNSDNLGGVARRKVLIDSIRQAEPNVLLVDAGDVVQGTVYFNLYGGEVEGKVMNALGYDYAILGNHEFDNGMEALGNYLKNIDAQFISTNYDVAGTPLEPYIVPYRIVDIAGKRIGLIGINVDPVGIIDSERCEGVGFLDLFKAANSTAWHLKHNDKVDYVVALTHIGYSYEDMADDLDLVEQGANIDVIIGGHSHTRLQPGSNDGSRYDSERQPVLITQTGSSGLYLGVVTIDTDNSSISADLIPVDKRLDARIDRDFVGMLEPYRHGVDSVKSIVIGKSRIASDRYGDVLLNFVSDFIADRGRGLVADGKIDFAVANRGGIRNGISKGNVTQGTVMEMFPFANHVQVLDISGHDLLDMLQINVEKKRVGFSEELRVLVNADESQLVAATINGQPIDPDRTYRIATIDYLANGGDYMTPLKRGKSVAISGNLIWEDMVDYISSLKKKTITAQAASRISVDKETRR